MLHHFGQYASNVYASHDKKGWGDLGAMSALLAELRTVYDL